MAKPKRPQHPAASRASRPAASGGNTRPSSTRPAATADGHSNTSNTTSTSTPPRTSKPASPTASAPTSRSGQYVRNGSTGSNGSGKNGSGATGGRTTSAAARTIASRAGSPGKNRRRVQQPSGWRKLVSGQYSVWIALGCVVLIVALFVIISHINGGTSDRQPVPTALHNQVTQVSPSVLAQVGTGGLDAPFKATPAGTKLLTSGGKPEFLYVGAEYCPHCAAERWSMVVALSRFGTFDNLRLIKSTTNDTPADVPTFTFYQSKYTSQYLTFTPVEIQDRAGNNLETLSTQQNQIFTTYDAAPYSTAAGAIPFLSLGNQYIQVGEGYPSTLIATDTWQSIGNNLSQPNTPEAQNILGNANYLTAAICQMTNNQPASVCSAAPIPSIQQKLPKG